MLFFIRIILLISKKEIGKKSRLVIFVENGEFSKRPQTALIPTISRKCYVNF